MVFTNFLLIFPVSTGAYGIFFKFLNNLNKKNYMLIFIKYWLKILEENQNHTKSENFYLFFLLYLGTKNLNLFRFNRRIFDFMLYFIIKNYETNMKKKFEFDIISKLFQNFLDGTFFDLTFINLMVSKIIKTTIIGKNSGLKKLFFILYRFQRSGNHKDFLFFIFFKITLQKIKKSNNISLFNVLKLNWFSLGFLIRTLKKQSFIYFLKNKKFFFKQKIFFDFGISKDINFKIGNIDLRENNSQLFMNNKRRKNFILFYFHFLIVPVFDKRQKKFLNKEKFFLPIGPIKFFKIKFHKINKFFFMKFQNFKKKMKKKKPLKFTFIQKSKITWICLEKIQFKNTEKCLFLIFFLLKKSKKVRKISEVFYIYLYSIFNKNFCFKTLNPFPRKENLKKLIFLCFSFYFSTTFSKFFQNSSFNFIKKNLYFYQKIKKKSKSIFLIRKILNNVKNLRWLNFCSFFSNWLFFFIATKNFHGEEKFFSKTRYKIINIPKCKNYKKTLRRLISFKILDKKLYVDVILKKIFKNFYSKNFFSKFLKKHSRKKTKLLNDKNGFLKIFYKNIKSHYRRIFLIKKAFYIWCFFLLTKKKLKNFNKWLKKIYSKIFTEASFMRKSKKIFHKKFFLILDFNIENLFNLLVSEICSIFLNFCSSNFFIHLEFMTKKFIFKKKHLEQYKNFLTAFILALFSSFNFYMINFLKIFSKTILLLLVKKKLNLRSQTFNNLKNKNKIFKFSFQKIKCPLKEFY